MMRATILAALAIMAPLAAQTVAPTVQQRFDAAQTRLNAKDPAGALAELQALEAFLKSQSKPNEVNLAITRAQQGDALIQLGRRAEARAAFDAALIGNGLSKPALALVRDNARLMLAGLLELSFDHAEATAQYVRLAGQAQQPVTRTLALMGAARTSMFVDAEAALGHIDKALVIAEQDMAVGKRELANVLGLKGRILNNGGRHAEAKALLVRAVGLRGGLTQKINQEDVSLRADAAIAMLQTGETETARKYLAYTGAGRTEVQLAPPSEMPLPACGGIDGLAPEDSAIIEFTILDDGRVVSPRPIYASRQGAAAYVFARAVEQWSWDQDNASKVKPFFRVATRVELRCSSKAQRPPMTLEFTPASAAWFAAHKIADLTAVTDAARAIALQPRLAAATAPSPERLAALWGLARNTTVESAVRLRHAAEAVKLAQNLNAPAAVQFLVALDHAEIHAAQSSDTARGQASARLASYGPLLVRFADPAMQAVLNLQIAQAAGTLQRHDEERAALTSVAQMDGLSAKHPLKVAALVQLANIYAAAKQADQAATFYARTGLSAQQCALVDGGPVQLQSGSGKFPNEALMWGFEGWTSLEYDVAADGSTRNARAVAAFPPRIFTKSSENIPRTMKYRVSYRPEGDLACTAMSRRVKYSIGN